MKKVAAVILAAGEGTRMMSRASNKCVYKLAGKPMIQYPVANLVASGINKIVVVVKFAQESVKKALTDWKIIFVTQSDRKGTAAALADGLKVIPGDVKDILVFYGDDSAFYTPELFMFVLKEHQRLKSDLTIISVEVVDPTGLGRIIRNQKGLPVGIVEEKAATSKQKQIREINTGCYCFRMKFLKKRIGEIEINRRSGEYYLTDILKLAMEYGDRVRVCLYPDAGVWFGVNTKSQWMVARRLKSL